MTSNHTCNGKRHPKHSAPSRTMQRRVYLATHSRGHRNGEFRLPPSSKPKHSNYRTTRGYKEQEGIALADNMECESTPQKAQAFMWRLIVDILRTRINLSRRGMNIREACPFCNEPESREHLIFRCEWTKTVWFGSLTTRPASSSATTIEEWLMERHTEAGAIRSVRDTKWAKATMTCWHIRKAQCKMIFEDKNPNPRELVQFINRETSEFRQVRREQANARSNENSHHWNPPPVDSIKIICDASWCQKTNVGRISVVSRNSMGQVV